VTVVSTIRVPPSSGWSSPSAAFLDYLTDEDEANTIRRNVGNHPPIVMASHARSPSPQTQRHYNIKSRNVQFILPPLNKSTATLWHYLDLSVPCSCSTGIFFCVLRKHSYIRGRLWTTDLWECCTMLTTLTQRLSVSLWTPCLYLLKPLCRAIGRPAAIHNLAPRCSEFRRRVATILRRGWMHSGAAAVARTTV